jgi:HAMP domain-containing protein
LILIEFLALLAAALLVMLVVFNIIAHIYVIKPIQCIAAQANEINLGNMDAAEFDVASRDEIGSLATSFNRMRRSLVTALRMFEQRGWGNA